MRTFVVGDVHGHVDRLRALLLKAGIISFMMDPVPDLLVDPNVEVVQLGDLIYAGQDSHVNDYATLLLAKLIGMTLLWGNHDRACIDPNHAFRGYDPLYPEAWELFSGMERHFALERGGFLLTHAGLFSTIPASVPTIVEAINQAAEAGEGIINKIGYARGGDGWGGILWRDDLREPLADIPQVYGHTKGPIRYHGGDRYCIDVGSPGNGALVGMWLDTREMVEVGGEDFAGRFRDEYANGGD